MPKMREYKFWNESGQEEQKEEMSLRKAVRAIQDKFKDKFIGVEYISKKGKKIIDSVKIPIGRKIRQAVIREAEKAAAKKAAEKR